MKGLSRNALDHPFEAKPKPAGTRKYRNDGNEYIYVTRQESELREDVQRNRTSYEELDGVTNDTSEEHAYYYVDKPVGYL
jgi:hypothetical protein